MHERNMSDDMHERNMSDDMHDEDEDILEQSELADPAERYTTQDGSVITEDEAAPESRMATAEEKAEAFDDLVDGEVEDPAEDSGDDQTEDGSDQPAPRRRS
jgi:hypothetical protein